MNHINESRRMFISMGISALTAVGCGQALGAGNNTLYIIHFNDVHGFIKSSDNAIGYAKIAGFIEVFKKEHPNTIVLDGGDAFAGSAYTAYNNADAVLEIMNSVGIDAMAAGNADFTLGLAGLLKKVSAASFPILSANVVGENGELLLKPSVIVTTSSGFKAGIIGLSPPQTRASKTGKKNIDIVKAAQKEIERLKPDVDAVIALAHLGDNPNSKHTSLRLARETHGLNLIVDGHSHSTLPEGRIENNTLIVQAGEFSKYLGLAKIDIDKGKTIAASARIFNRDDLAPYPEKSESAQILNKVLTESSIYFNEIIGSTAVFLDGKREHVRVGETNLGNLMADAVREACKANVAIIGAYAVGGEFEPGDISRENFLTLMRIDAPISLLEATGSNIKDSLEELAELWPEQNGHFAQVSGLSFELHARGGEKIRNLKVNGQPIDFQGKYTVATFQSIAIKKGFCSAQIIKTKITSLETALLAYLKKHSPVAPKLEGRITPCK